MPRFQPIPGKNCSALPHPLPRSICLPFGYLSPTRQQQHHNQTSSASEHPYIHTPLHPIFHSSAPRPNKSDASLAPYRTPLPSSTHAQTALLPNPPAWPPASRPARHHAGARARHRNNIVVDPSYQKYIYPSMYYCVREPSDSDSSAQCSIHPSIHLYTNGYPPKKVVTILPKYPILYACAQTHAK